MHLKLDCIDYFLLSVNDAFARFLKFRLSLVVSGLFLFYLLIKFLRTPEQLHGWIKAVVDAYHFSREGTLIREARDLMNPKIIEKLEGMKKIVEDKFM